MKAHGIPDYIITHCVYNPRREMSDRFLFNSCIHYHPGIFLWAFRVEKLSINHGYFDQSYQSVVFYGDGLHVRIWDSERTTNVVGIYNGHTYSLVT